MPADHASRPSKVKAGANSTIHSANAPRWIGRLASFVPRADRRGEAAEKAAHSAVIDYLFDRLPFRKARRMSRLRLLSTAEVVVYSPLSRSLAGAIRRTWSRAAGNTPGWPWRSTGSWRR